MPDLLAALGPAFDWAVLLLVGRAGGREGRWRGLSGRAAAALGQEAAAGELQALGVGGHRKSEAGRARGPMGR